MVLTESINNELKNYLAKQFISKILINPSADELLEKTQSSLKSNVTNDAIKRIVLQSFSDDVDLSLIDDSSIKHILEIIENYTEKISIL